MRGFQVRDFLGSFPVQVSLSNRYFFWVSTKIFVEESERVDALNKPAAIWKKIHFAIMWAYAYGCLTNVFRYMYDMDFFINSSKYLYAFVGSYFRYIYFYRT